MSENHKKPVSEVYFNELIPQSELPIRDSYGCVLLWIKTVWQMCCRQKAIVFRNSLPHMLMEETVHSEDLKALLNYGRIITKKSTVALSRF